MKCWTNHVAQIEKLDHVTLRRWLISTGYLTRNADGSCYRVQRAGNPEYRFDEAVEQIDVLAVIAAARQEIARRKQEHATNSRCT